MAMRVEITCETQVGDTVCLCGDDAVLGSWDTSKAMALQTDTASYPVWSGEIPVQKGGSFKFFVRNSKSEVAWEPLENRCWPSTGLGEGATVRMTFGEVKMGITASTAQLEKQARSYKDLEQRRGSALQENLDRKGDNAYYAAHTRKFEVPEDAKVITGEGLINGGPPVLLEVGAGSVSEDDRTMWLKDYSWSDSGTKVKVYVPIAEGILPDKGADEIVVTTYNASNLDLVINGRPKQRLKIEKLNADIKPEECTTRVEPKKNRIVLQLVKKRETTTWYNLTKSK
jgi:hypothetical protein